MQKDFLTSDGVRLVYQLDGERNANIPILLLNGLFGDMPFWDLFVNEFSKQRLCIRADHRGIGLSERWVGAYSYNLYRRDALELLDHLQVPEVHVVGLCHGGMVGSLIARDQPDRLKSLTLLGSRLLRSEKIVAYEHFRMDLLAREGVVAMSRMQAPMIFGERFLSATATKQSVMAENSIKRANVECAVPMVQALIDFYLRPEEIAQMQTRALFIVGEEDLYSPPWLVKRGADLWPNAQFEMLTECGHIMTHENPEIMHRLVRNFLNSHEG